MRRPIAVVLSAALIWQGLAGTVVLASQQAARDDWSRVAALKPNQKVTVEPQKGRGKKQSGRFVACDSNFIILRNNKGQNVAVARGDIRRVDAVTPGRESYFALGLIAAVAGGVAVGVWQVKRINKRMNRCETLDCISSTGNDLAYYLVLGAVSGGAGAIANLGTPRRVYEVPKIQPPPAAPRGEARPVPEPGWTAPGGTPATDPMRVIAALKQAPGPGLRLVMPSDAATTVRSGPSPRPRFQPLEGQAR